MYAGEEAESTLAGEEAESTLEWGREMEWGRSHFNPRCGEEAVSSIIELLSLPHRSK